MPETGINSGVWTDRLYLAGKTRWVMADRVMLFRISSANGCLETLIPYRRPNSGRQPGTHLDGMKDSPTLVSPAFISAHSRA